MFHALIGYKAARFRRKKQTRISTEKGRRGGLLGWLGGGGVDDGVRGATPRGLTDCPLLDSTSGKDMAVLGGGDSIVCHIDGHKEKVLRDERDLSGGRNLRDLRSTDTLRKLGQSLGRKIG